MEDGAGVTVSRHLDGFLVSICHYHLPNGNIEDEEAKDIGALCLWYFYFCFCFFVRCCDWIGESEAVVPAACKYLTLGRGLPHDKPRVACIDRGIRSGRLATGVSL